MSENEWTIVDVETTGFASPIYALEIAAQRMRGFRPTGEPFRVFLNHGVDIPWQAENVHGITRDFLWRNGSDPIDAHDSFADYVSDTALCSYNLPYDYGRVLVPEWDRLGLDMDIPAGFCMLQLARKLIPPPINGTHKLQDLRRHHRLPDRDAHSALGDVQTVIDLFQAVLLPRIHELGLRSYRDIKRYAG